MTQDHATREGWLNHLAGQLAPMFAEVGAPLPGRVRIAIAFPSTGGRGKRVGECWDKAASTDSTFEILIRPDIAEPEAVCAILAHELVHAAVGIPAGHGPKFRRVALAIGLEGKMKSTTAGPRFTAAVAPILAAAGPLPHASLNFAGLTTRPKKQTARMIKCELRGVRLYRPDGPALDRGQGSAPLSRTRSHGRGPARRGDPRGRGREDV